MAFVLLPGAGQVVHSKAEWPTKLTRGWRGSPCSCRRWARADARVTRRRAVAAAMLRPATTPARTAMLPRRKRARRATSPNAFALTTAGSAAVGRSSVAAAARAHPRLSTTSAAAATPAHSSVTLLGKADWQEPRGTCRTKREAAGLASLPGKTAAIADRDLTMPKAGEVVLGPTLQHMPSGPSEKGPRGPGPAFQGAQTRELGRMPSRG
jgi:hypothetical protein